MEIAVKPGAGSKEQGASCRSENTAAGERTFENLEIWQDAIGLATRVYETFRECRDFGFRDQIQRAAVSISSNIAEGYERDSNTEFIRYLFIAKGSCAEVRSQLCLAKFVHLISDGDAGELTGNARRLSRRIMRLIEVRRADFR